MHTKVKKIKFPSLFGRIIWQRIIDNRAWAWLIPWCRWLSDQSF